MDKSEMPFLKIQFSKQITSQEKLNFMEWHHASVHMLIPS
jgi:hypothetical protein